MPGTESSTSSLAEKMKGQYEPYHVRKVFMANSAMKGKVWKDMSGTSTWAYYETEHAVVLHPATDTVMKNKVQKLLTIESALKNLSSISQHILDTDKKILIPVTEEQKLFGIFPRNHWVTLQYDPKTNRADLLDSRPGWLSIFYSTKAMFKSLSAGLKTLFGNNRDISKLEIKKNYQGVQRNDIHCGAWTTANIQALAGVDGKRNPADIETQMKAYSRSDEMKFVQANIDAVVGYDLKAASKSSNKSSVVVPFSKVESHPYRALASKLGGVGKHPSVDNDAFEEIAQEAPAEQAAVIAPTNQSVIANTGGKVVKPEEENDETASDAPRMS